MTSADGRPVRSRLSPRTVAAWSLVLLVLFYAYPLTRDVPLLDPDEGLHAAIAQEMVERGDYVVPRFLGEPFLDKPALFFWAQAAAIRVLGPHEPVVRGVGLAFALLGAWTTLLLGCALFGRDEGMLAGGFQATLLLPLAVSQAAVHDVALVPWVNLALLAFWRAGRASSDRRLFAHAALAGVWLGLAVLTKGLVGIALVGIAVSAWALMSGLFRPRLAAAGALAVVLGLLIAMPWYLAVERTHPGYLHYFFVERHLFGFATDTQRHGQRPEWYYLPIVLGGGLPWVVFVPFAFTRTALRGDRQQREAVRFAAAWFVGGLAFLSLAGSKLVTYVLPVFPAIALLAAAAWAPWLAPTRLSRSVWLVVAAVCAAMAVLLAVATSVVRDRFGVTYHEIVPIAGGAVGLLWALVALSARGRGGSHAVGGILAVTCATAVFAIASLLPPVARTLTARDLARALNARAAFPRELWVADDRVGSLVFYLAPELRAGLDSDRIRTVGVDALLGMRQPPPGVLIAVREHRIARLEREVELSGVPFQVAGPYRVYSSAAWHRALRSAPGTRRDSMGVPGIEGRSSP